MKRTLKIFAFILEAMAIAFMAFLILYSLNYGWPGLLFGVNYNLSEDGTSYELSEYGAFNFETEYQVPDEYKGKPVTSIGEDAFAGCLRLTSVVIPSSVETIGNSAFYECSSLTTVTFEGNSRLLSIGDHAFQKCHKLVEVINHSSLNITAGSRDYGRVAYYAIEVHTGESKIVNADDYLFYTYDGVNYLFGYVGDDADLVLPDSYNGESYVINQYAFYKCSDITSVIIPDSVTSIGDSAFYCCDRLTSVVIPDSVTHIGNDAFYGCTSLTSITVSENNTAYKSIDGNLYSKDGTTLIQYAIGKTDTSFTIPDSVTNIGKQAFYNCDSLTSVVIPDSVETIGNSAFNGCSSLTTVTFEENSRLLSIGEDAFYNCDNLTSIVIPDSVTIIRSYAFHNCRSLTSVVIPDSATWIGDYAFAWCYSLTSITVSENNTAYKSKDGNLYSKDGTTLIQYAVGKTDTSFTIPDSVTSIGGEAFSGCDNLASVVIPDNVTSIGEDAFSHCCSLTSVVIPDSVTSIGEDAFAWCQRLTDVYYTGTEEEWAAISSGAGILTWMTTIHYNYVPEK